MEALEGTAREEGADPQVGPDHEFSNHHETTTKRPTTFEPFVAFQARYVTRQRVGQLPQLTARPFDRLNVPLVQNGVALRYHT